MRASWRDIFTVITFLLLVACVFYKTVILGIPVSRIAILAHWDSFFYDQARGQNMSLDPTTLLLYVPMYFLVGNIWRSGVIPLWNPLSGCGSPLIGDIESNIFSPLKLLFAPHPDLRTYNYILIGEVLCAALSAYLLARILQLSRLPAIFAAVTFCFCPFILNYLELTTGPAACFTPLVFIAFALMARSVNMITIVTTAIACSVLIFSGHPESSFFGIISGVLLAVCLRLFGVYKDNKVKNLLELAYGIAAAGVFSLAFSCPIVLAFLEYLHNSECYKFIAPATAAAEQQSIVTVLLPLFAPCFAGASPYLGAAMFPLLCVGLHNRSKLWKALALSVFILFAVIVQAGPLKWLFSHGIFAAVITGYAIPSFLLILCLLGAYGIQCLSRDSTISLSTVGFAVTACVVQIILVAFIRSHEHSLAAYLIFDSNFPFYITRQSFLIVTLCSLALAAVLLSKPLRQRPKIVICAVLLISWLSTAPTMALSLPTRPQFSYRLKEPLAGLNFANTRLLSLGEHLLRPDSNWVFGISDLRCEKSLFPKRYPQFMVACGARVDSHTQIFDGIPGPAFDFAAVPYVLAQSPAIDMQDESNARKIAVLPNSSANNSAISADLTLENAQFNYLPDDFALSCDLTWRYHGKDYPPPYSVQLAINSTDHKLIWCTDCLTLNEYPAQLNLGGYGPKLVGASSTDSIINRHVLMFLPTTVPAGSRIQLSMRVLDAHAIRWTPPIYAADFAVLPASPDSTKRRFVMIKESAYGNGDIFRLYRNCNALPQSYLVHNVITANSADESLSLITKPGFNVHTTAVIESNNVWPGVSVSSPTNPLGIPNPLSTPVPTLQEREDTVSLQRPNTNSAVINLSTTRPGLLVLADTFYPGWHAYVDGKRVRILRCNYLFRGVFVPEGAHKVEFRYQPVTFIVGVVLALVAVFLSIVFLFSLRQQTKNS